jgi:hypothetical protein
MTIIFLLFALFPALGYHPVLTHGPQPVTHIGVLVPRPVAHPIIVTSPRK